MEPRKNNRIDQCLYDIQKYEKWGNLLAGQCFVNLFNSNAPISALTIHNGMEYIKAKMKLSVLQDNRHSEEEKEKRLKQIDIDIHRTEEVMKNDLEYRGLLVP
jgi:hypothetical protein